MCDIKSKNSKLSLSSKPVCWNYIPGMENCGVFNYGRKKAVVKDKILTGTYILQKNRQTFSNGAVDKVYRHCRLEERMLSRYPEFYSIRKSTIISLKYIDSWNQNFIIFVLPCSC